MSHTFTTKDGISHVIPDFYWERLMRDRTVKHWYDKHISRNNRDFIDEALLTATITPELTQEEYKTILTLGFMAQHRWFSGTSFRTQLGFGISIFLPLVDNVVDGRYTKL